MRAPLFTNRNAGIAISESDVKGDEMLKDERATQGRVRKRWRTPYAALSANTMRGRKISPLIRILLAGRRELPDKP